jgi:predicted NAD-dependent protein-ADP-ribosyltransferase YbiA (DUF1768 family)
MTRVLKIFDPNDKPFGRLSNYYKQNIRFGEGKPCKTLANYIYANLLSEYPNKQEICYTTKNVDAVFENLRQKEINNIILNAIKKALKIKFQNKHLAKLLISTGDAKIIYFSDDCFIGSGPKLVGGQNWYGLCLEQTRRELINEIKAREKDIAKSEKDKIIYDTYLAYYGLLAYIKKGDDLKNFIGMSSHKIVEILGRHNLESRLLSNQNFFANAKKQMYKDIESYVKNFTDLASEIRKNEISDLRLRKKRELKKMIFDIYADYVLSKEYPDLKKEKYGEAKDQHFKSMAFDEKAYELEDKVYTLYKNKSFDFSERLSKSIDEIIKSFPIPSKEDVKEALNYKSSFDIKPDAFVNTTQYDKEFFVLPSTPLPNDPNYAVLSPYIQYVPFSPMYFDNLKIDNLDFLTISHYIITCLIKYVNNITIEKAYSYILKHPDQPIKDWESFLHPDGATCKYSIMKDNIYEKNLCKYAFEGLEKKFEDRNMQDFLLATGNDTLVYNDLNDPILGVGKTGKGKNKIGLYLTKLRTKIANERKKETFHLVKAEDVTTIFERNNFMKEWIKSRVKDMCRVLIIMKNYLKTKIKVEVELSPEFATSVLDNIYQPCSKIYGAANKITAAVPDYFRLIITSCEGFETLKYSTSEVLWKRLVVIIYYLFEHLHESGLGFENIPTEIARVQITASMVQRCEKIVTDEVENCIASALINLIIGIVNFNKKIAQDYAVSEIDVKTATMIILANDFYKPKPKPKPVIKPGFDKSIFGIEDEPEEDDEKPEEDDEKPEEYGEKPEEYGEKPEDDDEKPEEYGEKQDKLVFDDESETDEERDDEEKDDQETDDEERDENRDYSPRSDLIVEFLSDIDEVKDKQSIAAAIEEAIKIIKHSRMPEQIKRNRINFFATQR